MLTNTFPKTAFLYLFVLSLKGVFGADADEVKSVSVTEGDSVTLNTNVTEIQRDDHIVWMFVGPQEIRIAEIYNQNIKLFNIERFSERLQMENQTGSLTIRNIRSQHTGLYKLQILSNKGTSYKRFNVTIYTPLPVPVISRVYASSSESRCSLVCSVLNVGHVTLSWYAGISVLSSISVSEHNNSVSLPLEVEYQDKNTYSCVLNNPIRNQTTHLDNITQLCQTREEKQIVVLAASISAVLLLVLAGLMYFLYWKHKRMGRKRNGYESSAHRVETAQMEREEVQYAETGFFQQNVQRKKANETEETIYSSIVT
ncbi:hypothetical protein R3I94_017927 [Phoxinus phoxinus]